MSETKCVECNYMSFVEVTVGAQKYALCSDCGSMREIGAISGNLFQEIKVIHDVSNESSEELKFEKDKLVNGEGFEEQNLQDAHKMQNKFAALEIANPSEIAKKNAERNDPALINSNLQRSKDGCMYCDSTLLEVNGDSTYCKKCFYYQEEPLLGYQPMLISSTGKVIVLDQNGPTDVEIPDHTCRYCRHTKLETILNDKVCLFCNKLQSVKNFIPMDQIQFKLSSGKLVKLIDDRNLDDQEGLEEITAVVEFEKSKSNIAE